MVKNDASKSAGGKDMEPDLGIAVVEVKLSKGKGEGI